MTQCSLSLIPIFLADEGCPPSISLISNNGEFVNIQASLKPYYLRGELFETALLKDYSVITDSDYVWEVENDAGVFITQTPDFDQVLKRVYLQPLPNEEQRHIFFYLERKYIVNFSTKNISTSKFTVWRMRQGPPYWSFNTGSGFFIFEDYISALIENVFQYGGHFEMGSNQYTFVFTPGKSVMVNVRSGKIVEISRYPPITANREVEVNVYMQEFILRPKFNMIPHYTFELKVPVSDKLQDFALHALTNETRRYCVHAEHILRDDKIVSKISGASWYLGKLRGVLDNFTQKLKEYLEPHTIPRSLPSDCSTSATARDSQSAKDPGLIPVHDGTTIRPITDLMKKTLPNIRISKIEEVQNVPQLEKYNLEMAHMRQRNAGELNEKYLFHGTRFTSPKDVALSQKGFDFRYGNGANNMWGSGAYFAVNASYSDKNYAHRPDGSTTKQLILARVLTGKSYSYGTHAKRDLTKPPYLPGSSTSGGLQLYDTVNGETNGSTVYIVYDHDKSYPAYIITYNS